MKKIFTGVMLVLLLAACSQKAMPEAGLEPQVTGAWQGLGDNLLPSLSSNLELSHIALDAASNPLVVYTFNRNVFVKSWNGTTWRTSVGLKIDAGLNATSPDIATTSGGVPFVTWVETTGTLGESGDLYVKRRLGGVFTQLGGKLNTQPARDPAIAIKISTTYVAFGQGDDTSLESTNDLLVKVWKNGAWQTLGTSLDVNDTYVKLAPSITIDNNGNPIVAWTELNPNFAADYRSYVKRWNGSSWQALGPTNIFGVDGIVDDIAVTASGVPYLARITIGSQVNSRSDLFVERWNGQRWVLAGADFINGSTSKVSQASLAIDPSGRPIVSYTEDSRSFVKRFVVGGWEYLGFFLNRSKNVAFQPDRDSLGTDIAVDKNGVPFASWTEKSEDGKYNIYVSKLVQ